MKKYLTIVLVRFGFIVRGIIYLLSGFYGLTAVIGLAGGIKDTMQIVKILGGIPFGKAVLAILFIGFVGYGLWGLIRAFIDPLRKGVGISGLTTRFGYLTSGLAYLAVSLIPLRLFLNLSTIDSSASQKYASILSGMPGGFIVIIMIGLAIIVGGIGQIVYGYQENFKKSLLPMKAGSQKKVMVLTGKYGYIIRGVLFAFVGFFFLIAGFTGNTSKAKDPGEILIWIFQQNAGPYFLAIISGGVAALGIYSIFASKNVKFKVNEKT